MRVFWIKKTQVYTTLMLNNGNLPRIPKYNINILKTPTCTAAVVSGQYN